MTTQQTNTLSQADASRVACAAGARALDGEQRQRLAVQVLARAESVTELSARHQVSRRFLYQQADRGERAFDHRERLEQNMVQAKRRDRGRSLSKKLARARAAETTAVYVADTVPTLCTWLREDILALVGPDAPTRQALYDFVIDTLGELEDLDRQRLAPVRRTLANQRDTLLAFATRLDQELDALARQFAVPIFHVRQMLALSGQPSTSSVYWSQAAALHRQLHHRFFPLHHALQDLRNRFHRASSLVENFNSRLRNYFFLRNAHSQGFIFSGSYCHLM